MTWILKHTSEVQNADMNSMIKPLLAVLQDRNKTFRDQAEEIIGLIMPSIGYAEFLSAIKVEKTAVQQTLKPILERIKNNCGAAGGAVAEETKESKRTKSPAAKKTPQKSVPEKKEPQNSFAKAAATRKPAPAPKKQAEEEDDLTITVLNKAKRQ